MRDPTFASSATKERLLCLSVLPISCIPFTCDGLFATLSVMTMMMPLLRSLLCRTFDTALAECCCLEGVSLMVYSPLAMGLLTVSLLATPCETPEVRSLNKFQMTAQLACSTC